MGVLRSALLVGSENAWLRDHVSTMPFVRRAVRRFMPGERLEDALAATVELQGSGIGTVLTRLGENVRNVAAAEETARHYLTVARDVHARRLDTHISVKLTQLGLDVDAGRCRAHLHALADATRQEDVRLWIDMEQSSYVDRTLEMRHALRDCPHAGVCLQAYLFRTPQDLAALIPLGGGIRLVKGAYREPSDIAYPRKSDVDDQYFALAQQVLSPTARAAGVRAVFGTHDRQLIERIVRHADTAGVARGQYEFHLLFGIQRGEQLRLTRDGHRVKVLISYGEQWFPWYMRRLAERPANLMFVAKSLFSN